jgi:hypothetical protein
LVHPWLVAISAAAGTGRLHWLPLTEALRSEPVDAHLAIAIHRAAQVLADSEQNLGLHPTLC